LFCLLPLFYNFETRNTDLLGDQYRLTVYGQYFTSNGVMVGGVHGFDKRPTVMERPVIALLIVLGALSLAFSAYLALDWWERIGQTRRAGQLSPAQIGVSAVSVASAAQIVASLPWYATLTVFDRYLLLLLPGFLVLLGAQAAEAAPARSSTRRPPGAAAVALVAAMWAVGLLFTGEYMAYSRARATLYQRLLARGVAPETIDAGFELNSDTQVRLGGYINNPNIRNPPGAFREDALGRFVGYSPEHFPVLDARYLLSTESSPASVPVVPEPVDRFSYTSLLPPRQRTMYTYRIDRGDAPGE
jgi:hypothetical protein